MSAPDLHPGQVWTPTAASRARPKIITAVSPQGGIWTRRYGAPGSTPGYLRRQAFEAWVARHEAKTE